MDARHECYKEAFFNHLINILNDYVKNNIDHLVTNPELNHEIVQIGQSIYGYLHTEVDVQGTLSKHNLLSNDIVLFPTVTDIEANVILSHDEFQQLVYQIKLLSNHKIPDLMLKKEIDTVLSEYGGV